MHLSSGELYNCVRKQLKIISKCCDEMGAKLHHVKPHGAMYNMAAKDRLISATIAKVVKEFDPKLFFYGLSGSCMIEEAEHIGLKTVNEVFADRTYQSDKTLTPRTQKGALIEDILDAEDQVLQMIIEKMVTTLNGKKIYIQADTVCVHGDGPSSLELTKHLHASLLRNNIQIKTI
ncbi:MAG: LamB/YcsF family protein, partial [Cyclobacteriaceae bacterium]|nr:LamB/YcsF family protein [Cyclobacteriaceae bacterium]